MSIVVYAKMQTQKEAVYSIYIEKLVINPIPRSNLNIVNLVCPKK